MTLRGIVHLVPLSSCQLSALLLLLLLLLLPCLRLLLALFLLLCLLLFLLSLLVLPLLLFLLLLASLLRILRLCSPLFPFPPLLLLLLHFCIILFLFRILALLLLSLPPHSLRDLTRKVLFLVSLATARRVGEFQAVSSGVSFSGAGTFSCPTFRSSVPSRSLRLVRFLILSGSAH